MNKLKIKKIKMTIVRVVSDGNFYGYIQQMH